jgi:ATP-dependent Clp protease ATP-binding subunit ClpX
MEVDEEGLCVNCAWDNGPAFLIAGVDLDEAGIPQELRNYYEREEEKKEEEKILTPSQIHEEFNKYIIGQEPAKRLLAVAAYNHMKKIGNDLPCVKSNILLVGPTGCGKTLFAQTLAKIMKVPFTIADATSMTEAGYVGQDVESILGDLVRAANNNLEEAEKGIVFIDEIDKLRKGSPGSKGGRSRDISGEGVQQALLRMIEGSKVKVSMGRGAMGMDNTIEVDTSNILFICGGSFAGIEPFIKKRLNTKTSIGFESDVTKPKEISDILQNVAVEDLEKFGIIPELLGRLPILAALNELSVEDLERIITDPTDSLLDQFKSLFKLDSTELTFTKAAIREIARKALANKTGARGLRTIIEKSLAATMYKLPDIEGDKSVKLLGKHIKKDIEPEIKVKNDK